MSTKILGYIFKQSIKLISLIIAVCILTFWLIQKSPIDPVRAYTGANLSISKQQKEEIQRYWGMDKPVNERFKSWIKSILKGDLGISMIYRRPVGSVIKDKIFASLALIIIVWLISGIVGVILGILAGINETSIMDKIIKSYCYIIMSTPIFWLGMLLIMVLSVKLKLFPIALGVPIGVEAEDVTLKNILIHIALPAITLSIAGIANICLHTREKVIEILQSDYILFAKARGESKWSIVFKHIIRNASLPIITIQFLSIKDIFAGTIFAEQIFSYPGLGKASVEAGLRGDLSLLLAIVIISLLLVFTGNLMADIFYRLVDPKIRSEVL